MEGKVVCAYNNRCLARTCVRDFVRDTGGHRKSLAQLHADLRGRVLKN